MEFGTSTNLFSHKRKGKAVFSLEEAVKGCYEAGFRTLDACLFECVNEGTCDTLNDENWEKRINNIRNDAEKLGVRFMQSHLPFESNFYIAGKRPDAEYTGFFRKMTSRAIKASSILGVKWAVVHPLTDTVNAEHDNKTNIETNYEFYSQFVGEAQNCGVGIAFENLAEFHPDKLIRHFGVVAGDLIMILERFNTPSVGICWDFGHAHMMLRDQAPALRTIGSRLKATHVQDSKGVTDSHLVPFIGGNIPWERLIPVLREIGYNGMFALEAHRFTNYLPDCMRLQATQLAFAAMEYCRDIYENC